MSTEYSYVATIGTENSPEFSHWEVAEHWLRQRVPENAVMEQLWSDDEDSPVFAIPGIGDGDVRLFWHDENEREDFVNGIELVRESNQYKDPVIEIQTRAIGSSIGMVERSRVYAS